MKYFFLACIIFVAAALGIGFYFSGTPATARAERLDELRISNLSTIQSFVVGYYIQNKHLPNEFKDVMALNVGPYYLDPETKVLYEYQKKSETEFSLCANFALSSPEGDALNPSYYPYGIHGYSYPVPGIEGILGQTSWIHTSGRVCFDRIIDPQILNSPTPNIPPVKG